MYIYICISQNVCLFCAARCNKSRSYGYSFNDGNWMKPEAGNALLLVNVGHSSSFVTLLMSAGVG